MNPDMWYFLRYTLGSLVQDSIHLHVVLVFGHLKVASSGAKFGFVVGSSQSSAIAFGEFKVQCPKVEASELSSGQFPPILEQCPRVEVVAVLFSSE